MERKNVLSSLVGAVEILKGVSTKHAKNLDHAELDHVIKTLDHIISNLERDSSFRGIYMASGADKTPLSHVSKAIRRVIRIHNSSKYDKSEDKESIELLKKVKKFFVYVKHNKKLTWSEASMRALDKIIEDSNYWKRPFSQSI